MKTKVNLKPTTLLLATLLSTAHTLASGGEIVEKTKLLRYIDEKEPYTQSCEQYEYFSAEQRLKLLKNQNFMFGDILADSISVKEAKSEHLVERNITNCDNEGMETDVLDIKEELEYANESIITISRLVYTYGAGAAHGNSGMDYFVYDREYGFSLDWGALFGEDERLDSHILKRVRDELADMYFISYFKAEKNLENYNKKGYFGITDKGLTIQYGKYEIASGSAGLPSLEVPKEALKLYISKDKYERLFPQKKTSGKNNEEFISRF